MKYRLQIICAIMLIGSSCSMDHSSDESPRIRGEHEILAAVISYEISQRLYVDYMPAKVYFVGVGPGAQMRDPEPAILKNVVAGDIKVQPVSACEFQNGGIIDQKTGARGILIQLGDVLWDNDNKASTEISIWIADGLGMRHVFHLMKINDKWTVIDCKALGGA